MDMNNENDYQDESEFESDDIWDGVWISFNPPNDHSLTTATSVFRAALDQLKLQYIDVPEIDITIRKNGSEIWHFDLESSLFEDNPEEKISELIDIVYKTGILPNLSYNCYAE